MRAIVIHDAKDLRIEETVSAEPGQGEVLIQLAAGGICGSDLHYYNHGGFGAIRLKQPMILGHEVSGYVSGLGEDVSDLQVGDLVAVSPSRPCRTCQYCQLGQHNHCENMRFYGSAMPFPHIQGAFREALVADASQCVKADGLSAGEAAMAEPFSVCLHATRRAGEMLGKRVLITGSGPIGALCVLAAKAAGAAEIVVTDLVDSALEFAAKVDASRVINVASDANALATYQTGKGYFDVLYECSGAAPALASGIAAMRPRGVILQLGLGGDMTVPMQAITAKELDLRGSFRFHEEFSMAVSLMQKGTVDVKPLISHTVSFDDAVRGFELANDRNQAMKTQIRFS
ncbi:L-idonate 5-dehydrogenase [Novipirellula artificiosorum]|uniref:L-idonate 5-dehydrogenase (NAD(P)(+)) n=1 Tax=Novipirellula artificiosorum TaxID=2528016 RepID=A0A5C6CVG4_9BACT|nr:L-idonate 5-dehydrogenase [Novipirellula artificiosorum]TWU28943.1 L-idonate 5-dehydrogenase (NAD(P)(+)) [Novipirellula artificiosorum]